MKRYIQFFNLIFKPKIAKIQDYTSIILMYIIRNVMLFLNSFNYFLTILTENKHIVRKITSFSSKKDLKNENFII